MSFFDNALRNYDRRKRAELWITPCNKCNSTQVQLVSWLTDDIKFKCRKCKNSWLIRDEWEHSF